MILEVKNELKSLSRIPDRHFILAGGDPDSEANRESMGLVHLKYAQGKKKSVLFF